MTRWYALLAVILGIAWGGLAYHLSSPTGHQHLLCHAWVTHPTVLACDNGHSYVVQGGKLIDLGLSSGTPYLPKR